MESSHHTFQSPHWFLSADVVWQDRSESSPHQSLDAVKQSVSQFQAEGTAESCFSVFQNEQWGTICFHWMGNPKGKFTVHACSLGSLSYKGASFSHVSMDPNSSLFHRINRLHLGTVQKPVGDQSLKLHMQHTAPAQTGTTGGRIWI